MIWIDGDRFDRRDAALITILAILGGILAWLLARQTASFFFYQAFTPEALMWACGHGFRHPLSLSPAMVDFLLRRSAPRFDCASIAEGAETGPAGIFFLVQIYLSLAVASLWRLFGPTQLALWPLAALLFAAYATGTYAVARLFFNRAISAVGALALTLSPVAFGMVFALRDFSKAPFILWGMALTVLAARTNTPKRALTLALAAGVTGGIGYGFRSDVAILLPLGIGFLALASRLHVGFRTLAIAVYALSFVLFAAPSLSIGNGGNFGVPVMQGATEPFRAYLGLTAAPYALGHAYSDELTLTAVAAAERPRRPDWDAREPKPIYGFTQAMSYSSANLHDWAANFVADFATQSLKGVGWIVGYPALVAASRRALSPGTASPGFQPRNTLLLARWWEKAFALFAKPWMPILGFAGMLALLLRVAARHGREALALAGLFLALTGYPAIQFAVRHVFHLEFIWVLALLSLPVALWEWRRLLPVAPPYALSAGAAIGAVAFVYAVLINFQHHRLEEEFSSLLALPRSAIATVRETRDNGIVILRVAVPAAHEALIRSSPDSMNNRINLVGVQNDVRAGGDRLLLTLSGAACPTATATLRLQYDRRPSAWQPLDQTLSVKPGDTVVFPAFYRATQNFGGIVLPASHAGCDANLFRLPLTYGLPLVLTAVLPTDWRSRPLRKDFGEFNVEPQR
jgi:hypothetical protein